MKSNINDSVIIRYCKVLRVEGGNNGADGYGGLRIQVRLTPEDSNIKEDKDLPYVFPLLPKILHINPKVGETVMVILERQDSPMGQRHFIGPVISQPYFLNKDNDSTSARSLLNGKQKVEPYPNPKNNPANDGTLPNREDVAILGRGNSDIILKDNGILLRSGHKSNPNAINPSERLTFNEKDLGYIQMAFDNYVDPNNNQQFKSIINVVADRINLLSHDSGDYFNLADRDELITKEEIIKILEKAHPVIYGDTFMEYFDKIVEIIRTHTHPFPMVPPTFSSPDADTLGTDTKQFLSKSIKVN